jgi:hypothetical protein
VGLSLQQLGWEVEARGMRFHGAAEKAFFMRFEQDLPMIKVL